MNEVEMRHTCLPGSIPMAKSALPKSEYYGKPNVETALLIILFFCQVLQTTVNIQKVLGRICYNMALKI